MRKRANLSYIELELSGGCFYSYLYYNKNVLSSEVQHYWVCILLLFYWAIAASEVQSSFTVHVGMHISFILVKTWG